MKKYLLVCWYKYYPEGGLDNIKESTDTIEELEEYYKRDKLYERYDECKIYDRDTMSVVKSLKDE